MGKWRRIQSLLALSASLGAIPVTQAQSLVSLSDDLSTLTGVALQQFVQFAGVGLAHRPMAGAARMSGLIPGGLDLGVDAAMWGLPSAVSTLLGVIASGTTIPDPIPILHFSIRKGIGPVTLGGSFFSLAGITVFGGDVQWSVISIPMGPSVAVRGGISSGNLWFLQTINYSVDALASYSVGSVLEPYVGFGIQAGSGTLSVPASASLPVDVSLGASFFSPRLMAGLQLKLAVLKIVPEFTYNFGGSSSYGVRAALSF